jgi:hypothetical protein
VREAARGKGSIERRDLASGRLHHRLFSHITMNWRGRPLTSHQVVLNSIAAATTRTGLTVHAELDPGRYAAATGPRQAAPGTGRRPQLTLTAKLTAAILYHRHGLSQRAIATLYQMRPEDICRHIGGIRRLLHQTGNTIHPATTQLTTLDGLYRHATAHGIPMPAQINTAC